jgi:hypothetical protein
MNCTKINTVECDIISNIVQKILNLIKKHNNNKTANDNEKTRGLNDQESKKKRISTPKLKC